METQNKLIVLSLIFFLIGGLIGGVAGFYSGVKVTILSGLELLPHFTNITINEEAVRDALFLYKERINACEVPKI